jgi:hypothetical protein
VQLLRHHAGGSRTYQDLQDSFVNQVEQKLVAAPSRPKNLRPVGRQVAVLIQMLLRGVREETAPPAGGC